MPVSAKPPAGAPKKAELDLTANSDGACDYDASPTIAIAALLTHPGALLVDLDETLYLRNSTEDFIDLARPGLLALLVMRLLDTIKPWRWTGGAATRDTWRVRAIWTLFPWTRWRWRANVDRLAKEHANEPLVNALRKCADRVSILTLGFQPIAEALVRAIGLPNAKVIGSRIHAFEDRRNGKLHMAINQLGAATVKSSLVITDSMVDLPLLASCARPFRTVWPGARYQRALSRSYLPGEYTTQVKRPGERYIWRVVIQEDLVFWILSTIGLAFHPLTHVAGNVLLLASFWIVYERGYVDNDWAAANLETSGILSGTYWHAPVATPLVKPWLWAIATSALAVKLLEWPNFDPWALGKWLLTLAVTYSAFMLYNRVNKPSRIWLFAVLQFARGAALLVLIPAHPVGAAALGALILARWVPYYLYRLAKKEWRNVQSGTIRLLFFVVLCAILVATSGPRVLLSWTALALLLWNVVRARRELGSILAGFGFLRRQKPAAAIID